MSQAVEQILQLDMRMEGTVLHVDFVGRRARKFMNVDPPFIKVKGTVDLTAV